MSRQLIQKIIAATLISIAIIWATYNFFLKNKFEEIKKLKSSIDNLNKEVSLLQSKGVYQNAEAINKEITKRIEEINKKVPSSTDLPVVLENALFESLKGLDIEYTFIQPQPPVKEDLFQRIPINIDINGKFESFIQYLQRLENIPTTIRIDKLDITKDSEQTKSLIFKLTISLFAMQDGAQTLASSESMPSLSQVPYTNPFFEEKFNIPVPKTIPSRGITKSRFKKVARIYLPSFKGIYKGNTMKAFLNDNIYGIGDEVNGFIITNIKDNEVILRKNGTNYILKLGGK